MSMQTFEIRATTVDVVLATVEVAGDEREALEEFARMTRLNDVVYGSFTDSYRPYMRAGHHRFTATRVGQPKITDIDGATLRTGDRVTRVAGTNVEGLTGHVLDLRPGLNDPAVTMALVRLEGPGEPGIGHQFVCPVDHLRHTPLVAWPEPTRKVA